MEATDKEIESMSHKPVASVGSKPEGHEGEAPRKDGIGCVKERAAAASELKQLRSEEAVHEQLELHIGESLHEDRGTGEQRRARVTTRGYVQSK
jgi:hypothetical protein